MKKSPDRALEILLVEDNRGEARLVLEAIAEVRSRVGQTSAMYGPMMAKPDARKNSRGEMTRAGRRPPCSRPVRGSKSVQMRSPASGA